MYMYVYYCQTASVSVLLSIAISLTLSTDDVTELLPILLTGEAKLVKHDSNIICSVVGGCSLRYISELFKILY